MINHVASNSIVDSIELARHSTTLGAHAIAVAAPSYFKPGNEQEIANFIHAIAREVPTLPVYYYHIPKFNGVQSIVSKTLSLAR